MFGTCPRPQLGFGSPPERSSLPLSQVAEWQHVHPILSTRSFPRSSRCAALVSARARFGGAPRVLGGDDAPGQPAIMEITATTKPEDTLSMASPYLLMLTSSRQLCGLTAACSAQALRERRTGPRPALGNSRSIPTSGSRANVPSGPGLHQGGEIDAAYGCGCLIISEPSSITSCRANSSRCLRRALLTRRWDSYAARLANTSCR